MTTFKYLLLGEAEWREIEADSEMEARELAEGENPGELVWLVQEA